MAIRSFAALAIAAAVCAGDVGGEGVVAESQEPTRIAILTKKALLCEMGGRTALNNAVILIEGERIVGIGSQFDTEVPAGYEVIDARELWVSPGMIDLHNHTAGSLGDLNDMVFLTNPGIRSSPTVTPNNSAQQMAVAGGVTSVLLIPGSGTNMGGQGILLKTAGENYDDILVQNPGSLKLAQAGNPERWGGLRPGRTFMNWNTRNTFRRGKGYAKRWAAYEKGEGPKPEVDLQFEVFRGLYNKTIQVSTHTQMYQVVLMTITMVRQEMGFDVFIDHGTFDGYKAAPLAEAAGVPAILGPRQIARTYPGFLDTDGRIQGVAAGYQAGGVSLIGFNTDAPVIPQETQHLQAAMACRYGFDDSKGDAIRGLTAVPALVSGQGSEVGSLEVGKSADLIICTGNPIDPRSSVELAMIKGRIVYRAEEGRRW